MNNHKPTLLSINNYFYRRGGAESVFLEQNEALTAKGWCVVPFAMKHPGNLASPWSDYFVEEIEFGHHYSVLGKASRAVKVIYSLEARRKLKALIAKSSPAVAHAHNVYHHISPSIFGLLRASGIPVALTLHDLKIACPAYKMMTHDGICERCKGGAFRHVVLHRCIKNSLPLSAMVWLESWTHKLLGCYERNVDRFIVPSRFYLEKFVEWGWSRHRFAHVPNFVDAATLHPRYAPGSAFLFFGRLGPEKGLATLIRATAQAAIELRIAGTGPEEESLRRLAQQTGAKVTFLGHLNGETLHEEVRSARAVVLPSEWYENAPMSVLEAYALGTPVIGAAIGGIPELIRERETGWTFPSGDVGALADRLRTVSTLSGGELETMGRAGRIWVDQDFSLARYVERLTNVYRNLGVSC